ncbi:MAG: MmgE/PrpD family protein [Lachnospiraceae bacterium]|nr:MmgE/PrpD family protein [Lachnospiraceae bacterium]
MNKSEKFVRDLLELKSREIPGEVKARVKESLLDYLAVTYAGAAFQKEKVENYFSFSQPEEGCCSAIGTGRKLALKEAVFLNGLNGHALDYDDGTTAGIIHIGSPIFSLLLPLAQKYGKTITEVLDAAVIGYEASYTMAVSIQPGHKARGFHATGTCGTLGAAIAASCLLGLTYEETFNAFAAACVSASGMLKVLDEGSQLKCYNVAKTALLALTSVQLAKAGFTGSPDPLGGSRGFLAMMTGSEDTELEPLLRFGTYAVSKSYTKPYASCRYTHPAVEAAVFLRGSSWIAAEDIEAVNIKAYSIAVAGHDHTEIPNPYSAKMSIPYATAAGFVFGKAGLQEFTPEMVANERLLGLVRKVRVVADEELSRSFPEKQSTIVEVVTADGRVVSKQVDYPKGEPENPFTEEEFKERYLGLMDYAGVGRDFSIALYNAVRSGNDAEVKI